MCRHCKKLIEDASDKKIVHDFMMASAVKINRKLRESGMNRIIHANDLDVKIEVNFPSEPTMPARDGFLKIMKFLDEMHK